MKLNLSSLIFFVLITASQTAFSATWTWVGGTSSNYDVKANWSTSSAASRPQSNDSVIINAGATNQPQLTNSRSIRYMTINGGTFDARRYTLTVSNKIVVNGGSITNSFAANTGRINTVNFEVNTSAVLSFTSAGTLLVTVSGNMTFTRGIVETTSDDILIISDNATVSNASDSSHVNGPIRKIGNDDFTFPTGDGLVYAPMGISDFSSGSTTQYSTAYYTQTAPVGSLSGGGILSSMETWNFTRSNPLQTTKITLFYNAAQRSGGIVDSSDLAVAVYNGTNWVSMNGAAAGAPSIGSLTTASRVSGNIQGLTFSSPLGINALPVELINFKAITEGNHIAIQWSTTSETGNDFFAIEKSTDGTNWSSIASVKGAIQSNLVLDYKVIDNRPVRGVQYYRLRQTDLDRTTTLSEIVSVDFSTPAATTVSLYPNPATDIINIDLGPDHGDVIGLFIFNSAGQKIREFNSFLTQISQIDISGMENGVYLLKISTTSGVFTARIIKR